MDTKQRIVYFVLVAFLILHSASPANGNSAKRCTNCTCPRNIWRVCSTDGRMYSNSCLLDCDRICDPSVKLAEGKKPPCKS
ncbi:unnamed protein product [Allacma fusca]|uniref:Kazal-like domain-containing protein n=1 Tax=Allacma fusca TaxID=39272 RepID=A0A8J2JJX9_9HEXA|nr:unnamed protein product [Allacma fusca]